MKRSQIKITRSSGKKEVLADGGDLALSHFREGEKAEHEENYDEAFKCYHAAAELGHAEAQFYWSPTSCTGYISAHCLPLLYPIT